MQSRSLSINEKANKNSVIFAFEGALDEDVNLHKQVDMRAYNEITFDMKGLSRINSRGLRHWLSWVATVDKSKKYFIVNCPKVLIVQANMVKGVIPAFFKVKSVELPFYCEQCQMPFSAGVELGANESVPDNLSMQRSCPKCKKNGEFDALPETYFRFLGNR